MRSVFALAAMAAASFPAMPAPPPAPTFQPGLLYATDDVGAQVFGVSPNPSKTFSHATVQGTGLPDLAFGANGHLYVVRNTPGAVLEIDESGAVVAQLGDNTLLPDAQGITFGPSGNLFVVTAGAGAVAEITSSGTPVRTIGGGMPMVAPRDVALDVRGNLYVSSSGTNSIFVFNPCGELVREFGADAGLSEPGQLLFGPGNELFVASRGNRKILRFDVYGSMTAELPLGTAVPRGLALTPDGRLLVAVDGSSDLLVFEADGDLAGTLAMPSGSQPAGLAFAPLRFQANVVGTMARHGQSTLKINEKATLTYFPGQLQAFLNFTDSAQSGVDVASLSGMATYCFSGNEIIEGTNLGSRTFLGSQVPWPARSDGVFSVVLAFTAKVDPLTGAVSAPKAKGTLYHATAGALLQATVTTTKVLK